jgi:hypothetical protein
VKAQSLSLLTGYRLIGGGEDADIERAKPWLEAIGTAGV